MVYRLIFLLVIASNTAIAQREAFSWIWGYCDSTENSCTGLNRTAIMRFNSDSIVSIDTVSFPSPFKRFTTSISDSTGNFLMAFNQKYLFDKNGNVLLEYDTTSYGSIWFARQSALFLKLNDNSNEYYLINEKIELIEAPVGQPLLNNRTKFFYITKVIVNENEYQILEIDTFPQTDTLLSGGIHACRHANGRDWWILKGTYNQNVYLRGLLTKNGINFDYYISLGPDSFQNTSRNQFSSDGTKLFHYISGEIRKMQIYDFDRCSGELSNFREIDFSQFIPYPPYDFTPFVLSPDASKIYMGRSNPGEEYSYQNIQIDVASQQMTLVADSVLVPCLTPNLKWVVSGFQEVPFTPLNKLNVFTQPNEVGNNCGRIKDLYSLPLGGFFVEQPEWANHLLGPIDGSSCDTLGLDQDYTWLPKIPEVSFVIYPNPSSNLLNVKTNLKGPLKVSILDITGKLVFCKTESKNNFMLDNEIKYLSSGLYYVTIQNDFNMLSAKWVKEQE